MTKPEKKNKRKPANPDMQKKNRASFLIFRYSGMLKNLLRTTLPEKFWQSFGSGHSY
jgi:hypothetical protein